MSDERPRGRTSSRGAGGRRRRGRRRRGGTAVAVAERPGRAWSSRRASSASSCARTAIWLPFLIPVGAILAVALFTINISRIFLAASEDGSDSGGDRRDHHHARGPHRRHGRRRDPEAAHVVARAQHVRRRSRSCCSPARSRSAPAENKEAASRPSRRARRQHARGRRVRTSTSRPTTSTCRPASSRSSTSTRRARTPSCSTSTAVLVRELAVPGGKNATKIEARQGSDVHDLLHAPRPPRRRACTRRSPSARRAASRRPGTADADDDHVAGGPTTTTDPTGSPRSTRPSSPAPVRRGTDGCVESFATAAAVALGVVALAGCGSSDGSGAYVAAHRARRSKTIAIEGTSFNSSRRSHRAGRASSSSRSTSRATSSTRSASRASPASRSRRGAGKTATEGGARRRASTPSTATSPATRARAWKARSPSRSPGARFPQ